MGALNFDPVSVLANFEKRAVGPAKTANLLRPEGRVSSLSEFSGGLPEKSKSDDAEPAARKPQDGRSVAAVSNHPDVAVLSSGDTTRDQPADLFGPDALEERAALVEYGAGVPREWAEGYAQLDLSTPPKGFDERRWRMLIDDGGRFLDRWGADAARLGWSAEDVFGVHPTAPDARYDGACLVLLINGGEVVRITPSSASIRTKSSGATLFYLRTPREGTVALWELVKWRSARWRHDFRE